MYQRSQIDGHSLLLKAGIEVVTIGYEGGNDECFAHLQLNAEQTKKLGAVLTPDLVDQASVVEHHERAVKHHQRQIEGAKAMIDRTKASGQEPHEYYVQQLNAPEPTIEDARASVISWQLDEWAFDVAEGYAREVEFSPGSGSVDYNVRQRQFVPGTHHGERQTYSEF